MKFYLCLKCLAEEFDELLTSAPPRHPGCMGVVIAFRDVMDRAAVRGRLIDLGDMLAKCRALALEIELEKKRLL